MSSGIMNDLSGRIRGQVLGPGSEGYEVARRVYNAMHDRRPAVIVRAADEGDVMETVRYARENALDLAVRGGGHSVAGFGSCEAGVVLDLSPIRNVRVDPAARRARVGAGALLGDVDHATHAHGLATPAGFNSTTGVGGLTLGGGIGAYLSRRYGLTCDNLVSADVVTAAGERVTASEAENTDLFWALRGGGGNFGVVTSFELGLHPVSNVVAGPVFFELEAARDVLWAWRDAMVDGPRELGGFFGFQEAPPLPFIPDERHGDVLALVVLSWCGEPEAADEAFRPVRAAGPIAAEHVGPMPYPALQSAFDALIPHGLRHYWKADFVQDLNDEAVEGHLEHGPRAPTLPSTMHLYAVNGAVHDVPADATAFPYRDAMFAMNIVGIWDDPARDAEVTAWVRSYYDAVHPHSGYEAGYTNFMAADDGTRVPANYGDNYPRLAALKARWDPENLFRLNQNIAPAGTRPRVPAS